MPLKVELRRLPYNPASGGGQEDQRMSNGKILVVDDDKNICELLGLYLENEGYNVYSVNDGEMSSRTYNFLKNPKKYYAQGFNFMLNINYRF